MSKIKLLKGDITIMATDAIVNAANSSLLGGGGVDGAIHRAGGPTILEECKRIRNQRGDCPTGQAVITSGGNLPSKYVIHTVGPIWTGDQEAEHADLLASCYEESLKLAVENELRSIAFPNISTGVYGFPKKLASQIAIDSVAEFLKHNDSIDEVIFVCFDDENYQLYLKALHS